MKSKLSFYISLIVILLTFVNSSVQAQISEKNKVPYLSNRTEKLQELKKLKHCLSDEKFMESEQLFSHPYLLNENLPNLTEQNTFSRFQKDFLQSKPFNSNSQIYVLDSVIEYSVVNGFMEYSFTYNISGNKLSILSEKWDNTQWVNSKRETYTYDLDGNMLSFLSENWDITQWVNDDRETYTYDSNGNVLSILSENWDNTQWVNSFRETYTYDLTGNTLSILSEYWEITQWVNSYRYTFTYDSNGNQLSYLTEQWDLSSGDLISSTRTSYTYDLNNNNITAIQEYWENSQWVNSIRSTQTYDLNNNNITTIREYWENSQWVKSYRYTYTYDSNGNRLSFLGEQWTASQWVNNKHYTYTYDSNGNQLTYLYEKWINAQWVNYIRFTYTYNLNSKIISILGETWLNEQWTNNTQLNYGYDENGNAISLSSGLWSNSQWGPHDFSFSMADSAGNWNSFNGYSIALWYKQIVTGIESEESNSEMSYSLQQNFPNPFNPNTVISYQLPVNGKVTLKIYDILGREIATLVDEYKDAGNYETVFDASKLVSGVYLYKLQAGDYINSKKMILLK